MKRIIVCALCVVLLLIGTAFGETLQGYTDKLTERYTEVMSTPKVIKDWEEGVSKDYGIKLDHLTVSFIAEAQKPSGPENTFVIGKLRVTLFGFKDNVKVHLLVVRIVVLDLTKENKTVQYVILDETVSEITNGWTGIET